MKDSPTPSLIPILSGLLSFPEVMRYLGKSRPHIYTLMRKEGLPARRIGSRWMFERSAVDAWIKSRPGINVNPPAA
jgi:excisionase family DNA binding protein